VCGGHGAAAQHIVTCPRCDGSGVHAEEHGFGRETEHVHHAGCSGHHRHHHHHGHHHDHVDDDDDDHHHDDDHDDDHDGGHRADDTCRGRASGGGPPFTPDAEPSFRQRLSVTCPLCAGHGSVVAEGRPACARCGGKRTVQKSEELQVHMWPGTLDGHSQLLPGKGNHLPFHHPSHLRVVFKVQQHPVFRRDALQPHLLHCLLNITLRESLMGFRRSVTLLNGSLLTVDWKVRKRGVAVPGSTVVVRGAGLPASLPDAVWASRVARTAGHRRQADAEAAAAGAAAEAAEAELAAMEAELAAAEAEIAAAFDDEAAAVGELSQAETALFGNLFHIPDPASPAHAPRCYEYALKLPRLPKALGHLGSFLVGSPFGDLDPDIARPMMQCRHAQLPPAVAYQVGVTQV
jgi:hypothetical protein